MTTEGATPSPAAASPAPAATKQNGLGRNIAIWVCIVLGCLGLIASVIAIWAHALIFDIGRWADTLEPLVRDPEVTAALADRISTDLVDALRIEERARERLPERAGFVAPTIAEGARDLLDRRLTRLFSREGVQDAWLKAVTFAQRTIVAILRDESTAVQTEDGKVVLNLMPLIGLGLNEVEQSGLLPDRITLPDVSEASPQEGRQEIEQALGVQLRPGFGTIPVADSARLEQAQDYVRLFDRLVWVLPILTLVFGVVAIMISRRRLRTALYIGIAVAVSLLIARLLIEWIQDRVLEDLSETGERLVVAETLAEGLLSGLKQVTAGLVVVGVVLAVLAFLADRFDWFAPRKAA